MTFAPASILAVRKLIQEHVPQLTNVALGIVGSKSTTSYHLGRGDVDSDAYSVVESARDRNGLSEAASAIDVGAFTITVAGKKRTLRDMSLWLVGQCAAGAEDCRDIREIIYSPDGKVVKRWDRLKIRSSGDDSHLTHTHISWFRDSEERDKASVFRRWFQHIGALEAGDEEMLVRKGDKGENVRLWQLILTELGYGATLGAVDGSYGPKMVAAVNADRAKRGQGPLDYISGWHAFVMLRSMMAQHAGKPGAPGAAGAPGAPGPAGVVDAKAVGSAMLGIIQRGTAG